MRYSGLRWLGLSPLAPNAAVAFRSDPFNVVRLASGTDPEIELRPDGAREVDLALDVSTPLPGDFVLRIGDAVALVRIRRTPAQEKSLPKLMKRLPETTASIKLGELHASTAATRTINAMRRVERGRGEEGAVTLYHLALAMSSMEAAPSAVQEAASILLRHPRWSQEDVGGSMAPALSALGPGIQPVVIRTILDREGALSNANKAQSLSLALELLAGTVGADVTAALRELAEGLRRRPMGSSATDRVLLAQVLTRLGPQEPDWAADIVWSLRAQPEVLKTLLPSTPWSSRPAADVTGMVQRLWERLRTTDETLDPRVVLALWRALGIVDPHALLRSDALPTDSAQARELAAVAIRSGDSAERRGTVARIDDSPVSGEASTQVALARLHLLLQDAPAARLAASRAIDTTLDPVEFGEAHFLRATTLEATGDIDGALADLETTLRQQGLAASRVYWDGFRTADSGVITKRMARLRELPRVPGITLSIQRSAILPGFVSASAQSGWGLDSGLTLWHFQPDVGWSAVGPVRWASRIEPVGFTHVALFDSDRATLAGDVGLLWSGRSTGSHQFAATRRVVVGAVDGRWVAWALDGRKLWERAFDGTHAGVLAHPEGEAVLLVSNAAEDLRAPHCDVSWVDASSGRALWTRGFAVDGNAFTVGLSTVIVASPSGLSLESPGRSAWNRGVAVARSTRISIDEAHERLYLASEARVRALSLTDGGEAWTWSSGASGGQREAATPRVEVVGDLVLVLQRSEQPAPKPGALRIVALGATDGTVRADITVPDLPYAGKGATVWQSRVVLHRGEYDEVWDFSALAAAPAPAPRAD